MKMKRHYSNGELNRLVDDTLDPLFTRNPEFMVVDTLLHGIVEQNPLESVIKFIRYTLPKIVKRFDATQDH
jgi:hypothetical protein